MSTNDSMVESNEMLLSPPTSSSSLLSSLSTSSSTITTTSATTTTSVEETNPSSMSQKRSKVHDESYVTTNSPRNANTNLKRSELDSALALASMALDSPTSVTNPGVSVPTTDTSPQSPSLKATGTITTSSSSSSSNRTMYCSENKESQEPFSSKVCDIPIITPITATISTAMNTRISDPNPTSRKRVHFSNEMLEQQQARLQTPLLATRLIRRRRPMIIPQSHRNHHHLYSPSHHQQQQQQLHQAPPPSPQQQQQQQHVHRNMPSYPPYSPRSPSAAYHRFVRPSQHHHHPARHMPPLAPPYHRMPMVYPTTTVRPHWMSEQSAFVPPKPHFFHSHGASATDTTSAEISCSNTNHVHDNNNVNMSTWICDYCNSASFTNYHDACAHEEICKRRLHLAYKMEPQTRQPDEKFVPLEDDDNQLREDVHSSTSSDNPKYATGCIALSVEPADNEWLSELNCFLRKYCVEAFSATLQDIVKTSKRGRIVKDQVGIRCRFCSHRPLVERTIAAVSYPTTLAGIYESVKRWQRIHLPTCTDVDDIARTNLDTLLTTGTWVPTTRQYWADSARAMGMLDTTEGIRFEREPSMPQNWKPDTNQHNQMAATNSTRSSTDGGGAFETIQAPCPMPGTISDICGSGSSGYICLPEDQDYIPDYVFLLMRQVEPCHFTEADRFVARSKGPVGFAGFQCRHCQGHAGLGKYFPLNIKALSTNSTSQNIHAHILKCRRCPEQIKEDLLRLKSDKVKSPRMMPGWRKTFFERLWYRLHGEKEMENKDDDNDEEEADNNNNNQVNNNNNFVDAEEDDTKAGT